MGTSAVVDDNNNDKARPGEKDRSFSDAAGNEEIFTRDECCVGPSRRFAVQVGEASEACGSGGVRESHGTNIGASHDGKTESCCKKTSTQDGEASGAHSGKASESDSQKTESCCKKVATSNEGPREQGGDGAAHKEKTAAQEDRPREQIAPASQIATHENTQFMLNAISTAQFQYLVEKDCTNIFNETLANIVELTQSAYGFLGEVSEDTDGKPCIQMRAYASTPWTDDLKDFYDTHAPKNLLYTSPNTMMMRPIIDRDTYIENDADKIKNLKTSPGAHPPIHRYCGIPIFSGQKIMGLIGLANRDSPYTPEQVNFLDPLLRTLGNLMRTNIVERRTQHQEEILRTFMHRTPAAVAMLDTNLCYIMESDRWRTVYHLDACTGKHIFDTLEAEENWKKATIKGLSGQRIEGEATAFHRLDGVKLWIKWEMQPWYNNIKDIAGIIIFTEDMTEQKHAQENIQNMVQKLEDSNKELSRFAHICSHDLKEPLRAISSFTQIIKDDLKDTPNDDVKRYIDLVIKGTRRMATLIDDILLYATTDELTPTTEPVALEALLEDIKDDLKVQINDCRGAIILENIENIYGNKQQMRQVFQNLISNGLKFNKSDNPTITISMESNVSPWRIIVKDNGIGIDPKYHKDVFEMFKRLHPNSAYPGTGLGLPLCQKIIHQNGGHISIASSKNQGTIVCITLPKPNTENA